MNRARTLDPMRMALRIVPNLLAAAMIALAAGGCGERGEQWVAVTVIGEEQPAIADPAEGPLTQPEQVMVGSVAQGLVRFDARGLIEPGLAERWNVSEDGLSYIFRLMPGQWPDGRTINARDVARILNRQLRASSRNQLKDSVGAIDEIVAMTDRVIEIKLRAPRPNLLQLLAQPEFGIVREGQGTGPFQPQPDSPEIEGGAGTLLSQRIRILDGPDRVEHVRISSAPAAQAVRDFKQGKAQLVLGGTFADLPLARAAGVNGDALRFDPVAGLFGLVPARRSGPLADPELRGLLTRAIDRESLVAALNVTGLVPRATLLQSGLDGVAVPRAPEWSALPAGERHIRLAAEASELFGQGQRPQIAVALPEGPGATLLLDRLTADWAPLGIAVVRSGGDVPADLKLIDRVAPSTSPAWFVRSFRCGAVSLCSNEADELMESARQATITAQRNALLLQAAALIDAETLFIPLAAPIRWSLTSNGIDGFAENAFARHTLTGLRERLGRERR